ncbi:MAG: [LysW]-lysine hydrolase [Phycisphaerales bacterium]
MDDATRVLFDLVSTSSISGNERQAAEVFIEHASRLGFETSIDEVSNAIAHRGASEHNARFHVVLLGHIDTVPGDIPVRIENGILHGRGSVDAKGPLCAMLIAASRAELPDGVRVTVAGAAGEEAAGSVGARKLVNQWSPDACIIGEPSGFDGVTLGYKGRLLADATAGCPNTHSAGKDPTAPDLLHQWWSSVSAFVHEYNANRSGIFDVIQASILETSSRSDGLTQQANLRAGFRLPVGLSPQDFSYQLDRFCHESISIQYDGGEAAFATTRNDLVVRSLSSAIRNLGNTPRPKLKTGTSDMNVVAPIWNCPIAAYGPGDSALDHTPIEHLEIAEYKKSIDILTNTIESLSLDLCSNTEALQN